MFTYLIIACLVGLLGFVPFVGASDSILVSVDDGFWFTDKTWSSAPSGNVELVDGDSAWKITRLSGWSGNTAVDHHPVEVSVGDHVVLSVQIKTSDATNVANLGNPIVGGRLGVDLIGDNGASFGISDPDGLGLATWDSNTYVMYGTDNYMTVSINFVVQSQYVANQNPNGDAPVGTIFVPKYAIMWLQICSSVADEVGYAWFAHPELNINPSSNEPIDMSGNGAIDTVAVLSVAGFVLRTQLMKNLFIHKPGTIRQEQL